MKQMKYLALMTLSLVLLSLVATTEVEMTKKKQISCKALALSYLTCQKGNKKCLKATALGIEECKDIKVGFQEIRKEAKKAFSEYKKNKDKKKAKCAFAKKCTASFNKLAASASKCKVTKNLSVKAKKLAGLCKKKAPKVMKILLKSIVQKVNNKAKSRLVQKAKRALAWLKKYYRKSLKKGMKFLWKIGRIWLRRARWWCKLSKKVKYGNKAIKRHGKRLARKGKKLRYAIHLQKYLKASNTKRKHFKLPKCLIGLVSKKCNPT